MKCSKSNPERWMAYLYDELSTAERTEADCHLERCQECRDSIQQWRRTMRCLDQNEASTAIATRPKRAVSRAAAIPWALAAGFTLLIGFAAGRLSNPTRAEVQNELAKLHQSLSQEIRQQYREDLQQVTLSTLKATSAENREWASTLASEFKQARAQDRRDWISTLDRLEKQREAQYLALRSDVIDLAHQTRFGFRQTEDNLNLLASSLPPEQDNSTPPSTENSTENTP